ncbi:unnamed protein product [Chondrus crispus]|uniref:Uncharacterized protein n=1 Tax=Chondrus crispus TaxID=2769 RepID=R7Q0B8_CHOCR|nr:unnamed protein product [Chondrus crispus]CDF32092.1 unnamed protein product [Chondrus crispus]|eukprot:XP_005711757.1 unnamed protein product [Chondrus crispus]
MANLPRHKLCIEKVYLIPSGSSVASFDILGASLSCEFSDSICARGGASRSHLKFSLKQRE